MLVDRIRVDVALEPPFEFYAPVEAFTLVLTSSVTMWK